MQVSDYQIYEARLKKNDFATKSTITPKKLSIQTLAEEIKLVVTSKDEFEHEDKSILIASFGFFGLSKFFLPGNKKIVLQKILLWKLRILIETLMEELKPVDTEKEKELQSRDDSTLMAHFGIIRLSEFWTKVWNSSLHIVIFFHRCEVLEWDLDEKIEPAAAD